MPTRCCGWRRCCATAGSTPPGSSAWRPGSGSPTPRRSVCRRLLLTPLPDVAAADQAQRLAIYRLGPALYGDLVRLAVATGQADVAAARACLALAAAWPVPVLPITGADLLARGVAPGPELGRLLEQVRRQWEARDFQPDRAACLAALERLLMPSAAAIDRPPAPD